MKCQQRKKTKARDGWTKCKAQNAKMYMAAKARCRKEGKLRVIIVYKP